jgi:hypothetical protein
MNGVELTLLYVQHEDFGCFAEKHFVWFWTFEVFEIELHADLLEVRHFFDDYSVDLFELDFIFWGAFI